MKIEKAHMTVGEDTLRITMPLQKVDKQRRVVSGFATLDNVDKHGDVVSKEASKKAFSEFLGNVRLMHQPIPAGKVLNFREEDYFDPTTQKVYSGIYVDAYVSEGAEDVWKMVLDGTLTGFSIGGNNVVASTEFSKDADRPVRVVKSYDMHELSLVDNPANQFSNILSIQKAVDGTVTAKGDLATVAVENVFYCKKDHEPVALIDAGDSKDCLDCGSPMKNIGWFESDGGDRVEKVNSIIEKFESDSTEGGENMSKSDKVTETPKDGETAEVKQEETVEETKEVAPEGEEEVIAPEGEEAKTATTVEEENVTVTGTGEAKVEEAEKLNEGAPEDGDVEENPLTKMFDDLHAKIDTTFDKTAAKFTEATSEFEKKLGELAEKHTELSERFGNLTEKLDGMEKRFDGIEKSGAIKKSADLGGDAEDSSLQKSNSKGVWRGSIFSMDSIH